MNVVVFVKAPFNVARRRVVVHKKNEAISSSSSDRFVLKGFGRIGGWFAGECGWSPFGAVRIETFCFVALQCLPSFLMAVVTFWVSLMRVIDSRFPG